MSESHVISEIYDLTVKDLYEPMTTALPVVEKTESVAPLFSLLSQHDHVWVVDDKNANHLLGVITHFDTIQLFAPAYTDAQSFDKPNIQSFQYGLDTTAQEVMSKQPITVGLSEKLISVIATMRQHKIKQLAVVDEQGVLVGEISVRRLITEYTKREQHTASSDASMVTQ